MCVSVGVFASTVLVLLGTNKKYVVTYVCNTHFLIQYVYSVTCRWCGIMQIFFLGQKTVYFLYVECTLVTDH